MQKRYMAGIDGLRAISVIAVIMYHVDVSSAPGGFLGVGIFFVISGYLITDQLLMQWESKNKLQVFEFWMRRMRRLIPALIVVLIAISLLLWMYDPFRLWNMRGDLLSALFYVNNWWLIGHDVSYFESFGPPSPIGHLWSLSIEEQFYFIWPILLWLLLTYFRKKWVVLILLLGSCASAYVMAVLYEPGTDPSRVYYGTDTRSFALLIGSMLAILWPSNKLSAKLEKWKQMVLDLVGIVTLIVILWIIFSVNEYDVILYQGGLLVYAIFSALLIAVLAHPTSFLAKIIGSIPLRWIGLRSYSLYLWHYPILVLLFSSIPQSMNSIEVLSYIALCLLFSHFTWKFIEEPFRRELFRKIMSSFKRKTLPILPWMFLILWIVILGISLQFQREATVFASQKQFGSDMLAVDVQYLKMEEEVEKRTLTSVNGKQIINHKSIIMDVENERLNNKTVTAIGDSVLLGATYAVQDTIPGIYVDAKVSRQMIHAIDVIKELREEHLLGDIVVISLGTNGPFTEEQLQEVITALDDVESIFFVNVRVPRRWQEVVNETLEIVKDKFPNVFIIDWFTHSHQHPEYFVEDGVHLTKVGAHAYASLIGDSIQYVRDRMERKRLIFSE